MPTYLGLHVPNFTYPGVKPAELFPRVLDIAATAERSGFTALSVMDHLHQIAPQGQPEEPMLEAYAALAGIAARTSRLNLLTLVTGVTYHNPARLAKQVTTLDVISGGRAILGIGGAWFEEEHLAYGFEFPPIGQRLDRLEEALQICRSMFDSEVTHFDGRYYKVQGAINVPRPIGARIPILIGGSGERRTLRLVARYGDLCNVLGGDPATVRHKLDVLSRHCEAEGRDPAQIVKTAHAGIVLIDETDAGVARRLESFAAAPPPRFQGVDTGQLRQSLVAGTPDQVTERLREYLRSGADGLTFSVWGAGDLEPVALAGAAAGAAFD
jgi:F420-dependent oxidoreductase-like protein